MSNSLKPFSILLIEIGADDPIRFQGHAEDIRHALEQAEDAYPESTVISASINGPNSLALEAWSSDEFVMSSSHRGLWITASNASVHLVHDDETVRVYVYPLGSEDQESTRSIGAYIEDLAEEALGDANSPVDVARSIEMLTPASLDAHLAVIPEAKALVYRAAQQAA